jgi:putative hemolysin
MPGDPFDFDSLSTTPMGRVTAAVARPLLGWLFGLHTYRVLYERTRQNLTEPFMRRALTALDIQPRVAEADLNMIPATGPLVVASNHPHGAVDGLVLCSVLQQRRTDIRVLTNHLLARIPELADFCFFVDPFGGPAAAAHSQAGLRAAHLWLRDGGALVLFPSGEVAHARGRSGTRVESLWRSTVGRLALTTRAQVLPAFIEGENTPLFYAAGRVHPALRTLLLARELLNKRGQTVAVRLGVPFAVRDPAAARTSATQATASIRRAVETLAERAESVAITGQNGGDVSGRPSTAALIESELLRLPGEACLVESGAFRVFLAEADQIPTTLQEVGRLREVTYRAVGEGTGRELDLDEFDRRYLHLFSWDHERKQIVGAYRIGCTDRILTEKGVDGFYTRTLFRYDQRLIARLSPALELGRSFVRAEYQKNYNALLLLWKAIGKFVIQHPQYRVLFGPVSISSRYSDRSHCLLMAFLRQNHLDRDLAGLVEAINPRLVHPAPGPTMPRGIDEVNRLIAAAEADGKGVPILLRQYLKLNAKLLGFNVDPQFGDALDALMMVDLTSVDPAILNRYLGRQETVRFLAHHRAAQPAHAA